jgi:hypothetical protein
MVHGLTLVGMKLLDSSFLLLPTACIRINAERVDVHWLWRGICDSVSNSLCLALVAPRESIQWCGKYNVT